MACSGGPDPGAGAGAPAQTPGPTAGTFPRLSGAPAAVGPIARASAGDDAHATVRVLFMDDDLLVADKPAGLLAVPGRGEDKQDCLSSRIALQWPGALVVHRLDMATSGVMVLARHAEAQRRLGDAFARRQVQKRYVAIVQGRPAASGTDAPDAGGWHLIDLPIGPDWPRRPVQQVDPVGGKPSQTRWRVAAHDAATDRCRLDLEPVTGRTHQLRVHLQAIGHPILGDALYGPAGSASPDAIAPRLLLHATRLALAHPATGAPLVFDSPAPF